MTEIPELRRFARRATASITAAGERAAASDELYEHALSRYEDARAAGQDHSTAVGTAVDGLGDAASLSKDLARAHRQPLTPPSLALLVLAVIGFVGLLWGLIYLLVTEGEHTGAVLLGALTLIVAAGVTIVLLGRKKS